MCGTRTKHYAKRTPNSNERTETKIRSLRNWRKKLGFPIAPITRGRACLPPRIWLFRRREWHCLLLHLPSRCILTMMKLMRSLTSWRRFRTDWSSKTNSWRKNRLWTRPCSGISRYSSTAGRPRSWEISSMSWTINRKANRHKTCKIPSNTQKRVSIK